LTPGTPPLPPGAAPRGPGVYHAASPPPAAAPPRPPPEPEPALRVGALTVDPGRHEVRIDGVAVECTPGEFRLLAAMAAEPDRVFSRQRLLEELHGFDRYISTRTVDVHVMNLRKKIERSPRRPVRLLTVFGVGYKLTDPERGRGGPRSGHRG
ncbi:winged helix-turn-helix domain-containing protein, partial [Streptomyces sp. NPDC127068]|uniref:winged helix-turn-helix domain-containing protein n=1 Tax=Streptomyces sp. NPDC127068 TaxID=3347127 RepID=UPI00365AC233